MGQKDFKRRMGGQLIPQPSTTPKLGTTNESTVRISFEYAEPGGDYCLSHCHQDDVKQVVDCFRRMTTMTWQQVISTGSKTPGMKTGMNWTPYDDDALAKARPSKISKDIRIAGVRAGDKFRIFGCRIGAYFHVL